MARRNQMLDGNILFQFQMNIRTAEGVYKSAVHGAVHNETQLLQILEKTGLKSSEQLLSQDKYREALTAINALSENEKKIEINLNNKQLALIRSAIKIQLKLAKSIPQLAREQLIITCATLLEGFINDILKEFLIKYPQSLKSNKATLKDNQLIDSIIEGNTLEKLIELRIREIMYDSISGWIKYLKEKGFDISESNSVKEMFLIRNVLIHNNKKVGQELSKEIGGKRYKIGDTINVTENDTKRFKSAVDKMARDIYTEFVKKTTK